MRKELERERIGAKGLEVTILPLVPLPETVPVWVEYVAAEVGEDTAEGEKVVALGHIRKLTRRIP